MATRERPEIAHPVALPEIERLQRRGERELRERAKRVAGQREMDSLPSSRSMVDQRSTI